MSHEINCTWVDKVLFEAQDNSGHKLLMEAGSKFGGENKGFLPKPVLLASLAGCMGIDVICILDKMGIKPEYFNIRSIGKMNDEQPKFYHKIHLIYEFKGKDLKLVDLEDAVQISSERYCNVSALLSKGADITHKIEILE